MLKKELNSAPNSLSESYYENRTAREILMGIDNNFSRAVGLLNKYMPHNDDDDDDNNVDEFSDSNHNKAAGTEKDTKSSPGQGRSGNAEHLEEKRSHFSRTLKSEDPSSQVTLPSFTVQKYDDATGSIKYPLKIGSQMDDSKETPQSIPLTDISVNVNGVQASYDDDEAYYLYDDDDDERRKIKSTGPYSKVYGYSVADQSASRDLDNATPKTLELCKRYPCHYCFYVYFPSTTIDDDLMPFRRKAFMDKVSRLQNPEHVKEVLGTKCARDAYSDRRIRSIERLSGTEVHLSDLNPAMTCIKGLPRRRLTIAGPSFINICCALHLFEDLLPSAIKGAIFPYRLPEGSSTRFQAGRRMSSVYHWIYGRPNGSVYLRKQLDDKGGWRSFLPPRKGISAERI